MIKVMVRIDILEGSATDRLDVIHVMQPINDWCKDNCTGVWLWSSVRVFKFELKSDATLFKLVWG